MAYRRPLAVFAGIAVVLGAPSMALADTGGQGGSGGQAGAAGQGGSGGQAGAAGKGGSGGAGGAAGAAGQGAGGMGDPGYPVAGKGSPKAIVAKVCAEGGDPWRCMSAFPLVYDKKVELPIAFDWDTGWIPDGSALQVRFYAKLPAFTQVKLQGGINTTWPQSLTMNAFGVRGKGSLEFDYGLQIGAKGKVEVSVLGKDIKWEGDLPFVPKVDFHVKGKEFFDPWAWDPGVLATGYTPKLTLFTIDITDAIIPVPGVGGGVLLDVQGELGVHYQTENISIKPTNGTVSTKVNGPITGPDKDAVHQWQQGAWGEYLVHPEGTVHYGGVIHLLPSFYIEFLGKKFTIPVYDFQYPIDIADQAWVFDDQLIHVPLPDVRPPDDKRLTAGQTTLGEPVNIELKVKNIGEAVARLDAEVDDPAFKLLDTFAEIDPGKEGLIRVRFSPKQVGTVKGKLTVKSNDPDLPSFAFDLDGEATAPPAIPDPTTAPTSTSKPPPKGSGGSGGTPADPGKGDLTGANGESGDSGGCGCRTAPASPAGLAAPALLFCALLLRRSSPSRSRRSARRHEISR